MTPAAFPTKWTAISGAEGAPFAEPGQAPFPVRAVPSVERVKPCAWRGGTAEAMP